MNWRNRQIFGWQRFGKSRAQRSKVQVLTLLIVVVLGTVALVWLGKSNTPMGAAVIEPSATGAAVTQQQPTAQEESQTEEAALIETGPQIREFYEYKEECARDMKQRQDDINDLSTQRDTYAQRLQELEEEYNQKLQALKEEYQLPTDNARADKEKAERQLQSVLDKWKDRKAYCDKKYPSIS